MERKSFAVVLQDHIDERERQIIDFIDGKSDSFYDIYPIRTHHFIEILNSGKITPDNLYSKIYNLFSLLSTNQHGHLQTTSAANADTRTWTSSILLTSDIAEIAEHYSTGSRFTEISLRGRTSPITLIDDGSFMTVTANRFNANE